MLPNRKLMLLLPVVLVLAVALLLIGEPINAAPSVTDTSSESSQAQTSASERGDGMGMDMDDMGMDDMGMDDMDMDDVDMDDVDMDDMEMEEGGFGELEAVFGMMEIVDRLTQVAKDETASAIFAVIQVGEFMEPEEAVDFLSKALGSVKDPVVQRVIRFQLAELAAELDQPEAAREHLMRIIVGKPGR